MDVPVQRPGLDVLQRGAVGQPGQRAERLLLQHLIVGEGLEGTAQVGVSPGRVRLVSLEEQVRAQQIGGPGVRVEMP